MAEKRLIDAMKTTIKLSGRIMPLIQIGANPTQVYNEVLQVVAEAPTVDAVEVVRCRECAIPHNKYTGCPKLNGLVTTPDFYCQYGERRTDG